MQIKRTVSLLLCLMLLSAMLTACGSASDGNTQIGGNESTDSKAVVSTVAEPMDSVEISFEGAYFPDPHCYTAELFDFDDIRDEDGFTRRWADDCTFGDLPVLEAYVNLLCTKYNFKLVGEPFYLEDSDYYRVKLAYVLQYTGDAHQSDAQIECDFNGAYGDLVINGYVTSKYAATQEQRELHCFIDHAKWLVAVEDGMRYGKEEKITAYAGESFGSGLNLLADGSYETTDKRLSVSPGEAAFIIDGESKTYSAYLEWSNKNGQKRICVQDKFDINQLTFALPIKLPVSSGDIFLTADMEPGSNGVVKGSVPTAYEPMFAIIHGDSYILPRYGLADGMERFNVRMMYWDEDAEIAVMYFCTQFNTAPYEVEGLIAVSMLGEGDVVSAGDADYTMRVNEELELSGRAEFGAGYSLWTWEYISGSELSELHGTKGQTCTLVAHKPGTVRVKVTYEYSVQEANVLTGIPSTTQKSETQEYVILITE